MDDRHIFQDPARAYFPVLFQADIPGDLREAELPVFQPDIVADHVCLIRVHRHPLRLEAGHSCLTGQSVTVGGFQVQLYIAQGKGVTVLQPVQFRDILIIRRGILYRDTQFPV